jgi:predicted nucleotidyltransferase
MSPRDLKTRIPLPLGPIADLCRQYGVERLEVFGSVLRDDFGPESDVDFLVVFRENDTGPWLSKLQDLQEDLARLLGRKVDLVDRRAIERSENWIRRRDILSTAEVIHGS